MRRASVIVEIMIRSDKEGSWVGVIPISTIGERVQCLAVSRRPINLSLS